MNLFVGRSLKPIYLVTQDYESFTHTSYYTLWELKFGVFLDKYHACRSFATSAEAFEYINVIEAGD
jgi:hypothetical protein